MDKKHLDQLISLAYNIEDFIEQDEIKLKGKFVAFSLSLDKIDGFVDAGVRLLISNLANYTVSLIKDNVTEYCIFLIKSDRENTVTLPVKNAILDVKKDQCYSSLTELMNSISDIVPNKIATSMIMAMMKQSDTPFHSTDSNNNCETALIVNFEQTP